MNQPTAEVAESAQESSWTVFVLTILMAVFAALMLTAASSISQAASVVERAPIGAHVPLLTLEKNENPQNILVVFTKVDQNCRFQLEDKEPILSDYWLMNRERYKPVNALIQRGIEKRIKIVTEIPEGSKQLPREFQVRLSDFTELKHDLGSDPLITVRSDGAPGKCEAEAILRLGPSDQNRSILLEKLQANSSKKLLPPFRKLKSLTVAGVDLASGEKFSRTFHSK